MSTTIFVSGKYLGLNAYLDSRNYFYCKTFGNDTFNAELSIDSASNVIGDTVTGGGAFMKHVLQIKTEKTASGNVKFAAPDAIFAWVNP